MTGNQPTEPYLVELKVESLYGGKTFNIDNVVINKPWKDDCNSLLHKLSLKAYKHFMDFDVNLLNNCKCIYLLIVCDNACLKTKLKKREGPLRYVPHALLTPLGWSIFGGASPLETSPLLKVKCVHVSAGNEIKLLRSDIM